MSSDNYINKIWSDIADLKAKTLGAGVKIAILDGPVDISHPCFVESQITTNQTGITPGFATAHGTHVSSIMFSSKQEELEGICPAAECFTYPIFRERADGSIISSSQLELARSIELAMDKNVDIINISAGEKVKEPFAQQRLERVIERCAEQGILIVSAVGNNGCPCIHIPAANPNVLAVGALSEAGFPMDFSNWGKPYQFNGVMAPGEKILGAEPGGAYVERNGTSFATPIVTGVVALLYSFLKSQGVTPQMIRKAILESAYDCPIENDSNGTCDRFLKGILNISDCLNLLEEQLKQGTLNSLEASEVLSYDKKGLKESSSYNNINEVELSGFNEELALKPTFIFAIGTLDVDFKTDAVLDSFKFFMQSKDHPYPDPHNPEQLTDYFNKNNQENFYETNRLHWILKQNGSPIYVIQPKDSFSELAYQYLVDFLTPNLGINQEYRAPLISIPGSLGGFTKLRTGQVIPLLHPNIRSMYNWKNKDLVSHICGLIISDSPPNQSIDSIKERVNRLINFLLFKLQNKGITSEDRAKNYTATNLYNIAYTLAIKLSERFEIESIRVTKSNICRPDSDCQDVIFSFFIPDDRLNTSKHIFQFTIDVSEVIPVAVGPVLDWYEY